MKTRAARVVCEVHCEWNQIPPKYRLFVNDELFVERTYIWKDFYLDEDIPIEAPPGIYQIRYELLGDSGCSIKIKNVRVEGQSLVMHKHLRLEILP